MGRLHEAFYDSGNQKLSDYISTPGSNTLRRLGQGLRSSAMGIVADGLGYMANALPDEARDIYKETQKTARDYRTGIRMMSQVSPGEAYDKFVDNLKSGEFSFEDVGDLGVSTLEMAATEGPYIGLAMVNPMLGFYARFSQHYAEVENDPNTSALQNHAYALTAGAIETVGDRLIGRSFGVLGSVVGAGLDMVEKGLAKRVTSKISQKLFNNALTRGATRTAGVLYTEGLTEEIQERGLIAAEESILAERFLKRKRMPDFTNHLLAACCLVVQ